MSVQQTQYGNIENKKFITHFKFCLKGSVCNILQDVLTEMQYKMHVFRDV